MFEKFINTCLDCYGLDPCHYFSSLVLSNKCMECYGSSRESKYITYLDANNLYGWAMSQYSGFKWLNQKEITDFCLSFINENSSIDYILQVDLEYPIEVHELHNHYPLAPEKLDIS